MRRHTSHKFGVNKVPRKQENYVDRLLFLNNLTLLKHVEINLKYTYFTVMTITSLYKYMYNAINYNNILKKKMEIVIQLISLHNN